MLFPLGHILSQTFLGIPKKMGIFWVVLTFDTKLMCEIIGTLGNITLKQLVIIILWNNCVLLSKRVLNMICRAKIKLIKLLTLRLHHGQSVSFIKIHNATCSCYRT